MDETQHGFPYYHRRIAREEGALLFRLRWYADGGTDGLDGLEGLDGGGSLSFGVDNTVFVPILSMEIKACLTQSGALHHRQHTHVDLASIQSPTLTFHCIPTFNSLTYPRTHPPPRTQVWRQEVARLLRAQDAPRVLYVHTHTHSPTPARSRLQLSNSRLFRDGDM